MSDVKQLIAEARGAAELERVRRLRDALEATVSDDDREALARVAFDAWQGKGFDAEFEYQKPEWLEVADAIIAAGFRRSPAPEQVSTVEELDALPTATVILDRVGQAHQKAMNGYWYLAAGDDDGHDADEYVKALPATVLFRPEGGESNE